MSLWRLFSFKPPQEVLTHALCYNQASQTAGEQGGGLEGGGGGKGATFQIGWPA